MDAWANFPYSTVATAPSPATSGTSLVVQAGHGARFPTAPFNAVIWPAGNRPTVDNAEIVRVTNVSTDTLTIDREEEGTTARTVIVGDQIAANITKKFKDDLDTALAAKMAKSANLSDVANAGTSRTNLGVGTGDSPYFTGVNIGHATDTTVSRAGAGDLAVEGNLMYRAGGTDVPVADGGTGVSTLGSGNVLVGAGTSAVTSSKAAPSGDFVGTTDTQTLSGKTLTAPTIADFTNANHDHGDADDGGALANGIITNAMLATAAGAPGGAWQSWTPTLSGRFNDSKWTKTCRYIQVGKRVWFSLKLVASTTTPMDGGTVGATFTLPVTADTNYVGGSANVSGIGFGGILDSGTAVFSAQAFIASSTTARVNVIDSSGTYGVVTNLSSTIPMTWTTSDEIAIEGFYEAA